MKKGRAVMSLEWRREMRRRAGYIRVTSVVKTRLLNVFHQNLKMNYILILHICQSIQLNFLM